MANYLVILVLESDHSYQVDVLDDLGQPTGEQKWEYGLFWTFVQNLQVSGVYKRLITEQAPIYLKAGVRYKAHIFPTSRFPVADYDAWSSGMRAALTAAGITFEAATVPKVQIQEWIAAQGFMSEAEEQS